MVAFRELPDIIEFDLQTAAGGPGVNPYSAFGLRGRLAPIKEAGGEDKFPRSINGGVIDLSAPQMRKLRLEISGNSPSPPALDNVWPGDVVAVSCLTEASYLTASGTASRSAVSGSERTEGAYSFYRPFLTMKVVEWDVDRDAWAANVTWRLTLIEI
jgi:hypothetical protein